MTEFRLTQISDTHLAPPLPQAHRQFPSRQRAYRRDTARSRRQQRRSRLRWSDQSRRSRICPNAARSASGRPAAICQAITTSATTRPRSARRRHSRLRNELARPFCRAFGEDRWCFEAAGWCFIGLNSLVMNTGLAERGRAVRLARPRSSRRAHGRPVALFLHKPLFLNTPDDPELAATAIRYVPLPRRARG